MDVSLKCTLGRSVACKGNPSECQKCGWNTAVIEERSAWKLKKCVDGLLRLRPKDSISSHGFLLLPETSLQLSDTK